MTTSPLVRYMDFNPDARPPIMGVYPAEAAESRLRDLRNRVAHHEPILHLDLAAKHAELRGAIGFKASLSAWRDRAKATLAAAGDPRDCDAGLLRLFPKV